jgi:hypothetical protein
MAKVLITSHRLGHLFHLMVNGVAAATLKVGFACEVPDEHLDALRATDPEMKMTVLSDEAELQKAVDAIAFLDSLPREMRDKAMDRYFDRKTAVQDAEQGPAGEVLGEAGSLGQGDNGSQTAAGGQSSAASQGDGSSSEQGPKSEPAAEGDTGEQPADPTAPTPGNTDAQEPSQGASA